MNLNHDFMLVRGDAFTFDFTRKDSSDAFVPLVGSVKFVAREAQNITHTLLSIDSSALLTGQSMAYNNSTGNIALNDTSARTLSIPAWIKNAVYSIKIIQNSGQTETVLAGKISILTR